MHNLPQEDYDEWNADYEAQQESNTCPGCGKIHAPSKDCKGEELVRPPQRGGTVRALPPPLTPGSLRGKPLTHRRVT